ncbi:MAG: YCF48-related protein [Cytophagales bacterium]|nr:YCF48-related protein [Cytophagales bacterium]MDW8384632.1 YCF48-related protein [Flammeovirgaceae bacterium]
MKILKIGIGAFLFIVNFDCYSQNYAVGANGTLLRTTTQGASWQPISTSISQDIRAIWQRGKDTLLLGSGQNLFFWRSDTSDVRFMDSLSSNQPSQENIADIAFFSGSNQNHGVVTNELEAGTPSATSIFAMRTTNFGQTWTKATPSQRILAFPSVSIAPTSTNIGYMLEGTDANYILRVDQNINPQGGSVSYSRSIPGIQPVFRSVANRANTVLAVGDWGTAFLSHDNGNTWRNLNDTRVDTGSLRPANVSFKNLKYCAISPNGNIMLVCGDSGYVARSTNGGNTWTQSILSPATTTSFRGIGFANNDTIILVGLRFGGTGFTQFSPQGDLTIYRSTNGGVSFTRVSSTNIEQAGTLQFSHTHRVHFANSQVGYIAVIGRSNPNENFILRTSDGGATWKNYYPSFGSPNVTSRQIQDIWAVGPDTVLFALGGSFFEGRIVRGIYDGVNDTLSWAVVNVFSTGVDWGKYALFSPNGTNFYAVGNGGIWFSNDRGNSWGSSAAAANPIETSQKTVFISISGNWVVSNDPGSLYKTDGTYTNWVKIMPDPRRYGRFRDIFAITNTIVYAVGTNGIIYKSTNANATDPANYGYANTFYQNISPAGVTDNLNAVFFTHPDTGVVVGENGVIYTTNNGGLTWTPRNSNTTQTLNDVFFSRPQIGVAVGNNGTIVRTTDGGQTWTPVNSGTTQHLYRVTMRDTTMPTGILTLKAEPLQINVNRNSNLQVAVTVQGFSNVSSLSGTMNWNSNVFSVASTTPKLAGLNITSAIGQISFSYNGAPTNLANNDTLLILTLNASGKFGDSSTVVFGGLSSNLSETIGQNTGFLHINAPNLTLSISTNKSSICVGGDSLTVSLSTTGTDNFSTNAIVRVMLSNASGSFSSPTLLAMTNTYTTSISVATPMISNSTQYKIGVSVNDNTMVDSFFVVSSNISAVGSNTAPTITKDALDTLTASIVGDSYSWFFNNSSLSVTTRKFKAQSYGTYKVRAIINGCPTPFSNDFHLVPLISFSHSTSTSSLCAGDSFTVSVNYTNEDTFMTVSLRAELSNASGSFATPTVIGTSNHFGNFNAIIPANAVGSTGYRVRVVASGTPIVADTISNFTLLTIVARPAKPVITQISKNQLQASGTGTFSWSNSATGNPITVSTAGSYRVSVTNNGCTSELSEPYNFSPTQAVITSVSPSSAGTGESITVAVTVTGSFDWKGSGDLNIYLYLADSLGGNPVLIGSALNNNVVAMIPNVSAGSYKLYADVFNTILPSTEKLTTAMVNFTVNPAPLGLNNEITASALIYPNPTYDGNIFVRTPEKTTLSIWSLTGEQLKVYNLEEGTQSILLELPSGMYLAKIVMGSRVITQKISIK